MRAAKRPESKYWCFTVNNPKEDDVAGCPYSLAGEFVWDAPWPYWAGVSYVIWSYEVGEQGTPHVQGYLECSRKQRLTALKKLAGLEGAHFEMRRGTQAQAIAYCDKRGHPELYTLEEQMTHLAGPYWNGVPSAVERGQGKSLCATPVTIYELTRAGKTDRELWEEYPSLMMQHHAKPKIIRDVFHIVPAGERTEAPVVFLLVGPPGVGKTTITSKIVKALGSVYYVSYPATGVCWFEPSYQQQECVVFEDFDGRYMTPMHFKKLIDSSPTTVPIKGRSAVNFNSPFIFITSNYHPKYWWRREKLPTNDLEAILRRITFTFFVRTYQSEEKFRAKRNPLGFSNQLVLPDLEPPRADPPLVQAPKKTHNSNKKLCK